MGTLNPNAVPFVPTAINIAKAHVSVRLAFPHKSIPKDFISCSVHEYPHLPVSDINSDKSSNTTVKDKPQISILNPCANIFIPNVYESINARVRNDDSGEPTSYAILKDLRLKNNNRIIFAHINMNTIRNRSPT